MNKTGNTFLLAGNQFMPEMHLKRPGFTYSACGSFTRNQERIEKFMQTGNIDYIYKREIVIVFNMIWLMQNRKP